MNIDDTISCIRIWSIEKGIGGPGGKASKETQYNKLVEEVQELHDAINRNNEADIIDAVGDCVVVLTILAERAGLAIEDCTLAAYNEIKGRTGQMVDGVFVKDNPEQKETNE